MKNIVICCPEHKKVLSKQEELNLKVTEHFNKEFDKVFILPDNIPKEYYQVNFPTWNIIQIDNVHFRNNLSYNKLMLSNLPYKFFLKYKFVLICQSDAVVVKNIKDLPEKYDYIGAPWENGIYFKGSKLRVGNGGLSLRKVKIFYLLTSILWFLKKTNANEDIVFSYLGKFKFIKIPPFYFANNIFKETTSCRLLDLDNSFGFHALEKWNKELQILIHNSVIKK